MCNIEADDNRCSTYCTSSSRHQLDLVLQYTGDVQDTCGPIECTYGGWTMIPNRQPEIKSSLS